jgi:hypothetical protein
MTTMLFLFLQLISWNGGHDIHVSRAEMDYNLEDKAIQVSLHIYIDDLEDILIKYGAPSLKIGTEKEHFKADSFITDYINKNFNCVVNGEDKDFDFIGKEMSTDLLAIWCYIQIEDIPILESLELGYSVLMDLYDDQRNIIEYSNNGAKPKYALSPKADQVEKIESYFHAKKDIYSSHQIVPIPYFSFTGSKLQI